MEHHTHCTPLTRRRSGPPYRSSRLALAPFFAGSDGCKFVPSITRDACGFDAGKPSPRQRTPASPRPRATSPRPRSTGTPAGDGGLGGRRAFMHAAVQRLGLPDGAGALDAPIQYGKPQLIGPDALEGWNCQRRLYSVSPVFILARWTRSSFSIGWNRFPALTTFMWTARV